MLTKRERLQAMRPETVKQAGKEWLGVDSGQAGHGDALLVSPTVGIQPFQEAQAVVIGGFRLPYFVNDLSRPTNGIRMLAEIAS
ncbi:MAG TPA: hypothetical protein VFK12_03230 [Gammaproteobacteria bacterium]|nr:hypothetical protein [Gammaproteobacteria bacterium]